jgi:sigma-B regulation protein RsbU (phosphoserine phosphatase)
MTRIDKVTLAALVVRVTYLVIAVASGSQLPAATLVRVFFNVTVILFLVLSFPRLMRRFLWRVRHRLLVTWIFVGVVPIVLIFLLLAEVGFILMGQLVSYMTTNELVRESESIRSAADTLAWTIEHSSPAAIPQLATALVKETSESRHSEVGAVVRVGQNVVVTPQGGSISEIPAWSQPGSFGLIKDKTTSRYYFGAHVTKPVGKDAAEVFVYEAAPDEFFKKLLPGVAMVLPVAGNVNAQGIDIRMTEKKQSGIHFTRPESNPDPVIGPLTPPPGRGWWDREVDWVVLMKVKDLATGKDDTASSLAIVSSRPSLIIGKLFSTLGTTAGAIVVIAVFTVFVLLIVEIVAAFFGFKLARSITRAVADLYEGTRQVQAGDFSHRIPVRKTKDQLSELGSSFNAMTGRIEDLIDEVKEKERLENELEIAREVQSQLFPKEFPQVKTLQLWGECQPARTVSGDYYDFVSLGTASTALAIGDISGKGISAALLMAHIQSALRSQLEDRGSEVLSPSAILSILNNHLYKSSPPEKYATFFLGLYSDQASQLLYTNAGHLAPMIVRKGDVFRLPGDGFPVGLFPGVQYDQQAASLQPGDVLAAFTDGVTETPNRDGEEFGDKRLTELLIRYNTEPLDRIASEITASVGAWAGDVERHDDTTIILARRLP